MEPPTSLPKKKIIRRKNIDASNNTPIVNNEKYSEKVTTMFNNSYRKEDELYYVKQCILPLVKQDPSIEETIKDHEHKDSLYERYEIVNGGRVYDEKYKNSNLFSTQSFYHFAWGIDDVDLDINIPIQNFELLDLEKPSPFILNAFNKPYLQIEEHHFTEDYKKKRSENHFTNHFLIVMTIAITYIGRNNSLESIVYNIKEEEKYAPYRKDFVKFFWDKGVDIGKYYDEIATDFEDAVTFQLPIIKGFNVYVDGEKNAIMCDIVFEEV
jgi:hypothetical protein